MTIRYDNSGRDSGSRTEIDLCQICVVTLSLGSGQHNDDLWNNADSGYHTALAVKIFRSS
jgi:hypothetical protein